MTESEPPAKPGAADVLSSLPRSRPQRRSSKRGAPAPAVPKAPASKRATAKPTSPSTHERRRSKPDAVRPSAATRNAARGSAEPPRRQADAPTGMKLVGTAVAAAGELAELGFTLGVRALRGVAARLPRPK